MRARETTWRDSVSTRDGGKVGLLKELDCGALGTRWLARRTQGDDRGRLITVRRLPVAALDHLEVGQLAAAAAATVRVVHPRIVKVLDVTRVGDELWSLSEQIDGALLATLLGDAAMRKRPVSVGVALRIVRDLADAALAARRELAPYRPTRVVWNQACLIAAYGEGLVMDVGLVDAYASCSPPRANSELVAELAPEQLDGGLVGNPAVLGESADVFALGQVLWGLLAGARRISERSLARTRARLRQGSLPPLAATEHGSRAPEVVRTLADRAGHFDPQVRYQSLEQLIEALDGLPAELMATERAVAEAVQELASRNMREGAQSTPTSVACSTARPGAPREGIPSGLCLAVQTHSGTFPVAEEPTQPDFAVDLAYAYVASIPNPSESAVQGRESTRAQPWKTMLKAPPKPVLRLPSQPRPPLPVRPGSGMSRPSPRTDPHLEREPSVSPPCPPVTAQVLAGSQMRLGDSLQAGPGVSGWSVARTSVSIPAIEPQTLTSPEVSPEGPLVVTGELVEPSGEPAQLREVAVIVAEVVAPPPSRGSWWRQVAALVLVALVSVAVSRQWPRVVDAATLTWGRISAALGLGGAADSARSRSAALPRSAGAPPAPTAPTARATAERGSGSVDTAGVGLPDASPHSSATAAPVGVPVRAESHSVKSATPPARRDLVPAAAPRARRRSTKASATSARRWGI